MQLRGWLGAVSVSIPNTANTHAGKQSDSIGQHDRRNSLKKQTWPGDMSYDVANIIALRQRSNCSLVRARKAQGQTKKSQKRGK